ncbi:MAG: NTP transferase domain-containing protein [Oscillospiraceae bacterium]|nr:NTP transferase domain-containing protein [Oscillospiraceae bacterium]
MNIDYIIVQAGGKGTRLDYLTSNKPKALVPVENLPLLFHLFKEFKDKRFIVIADYKKEVLREYLDCFAKVQYQVVDAAEMGNCAGLKEALDHLPDGEPFMLIWSDLILPNNFLLPHQQGNYIGISQTFPCRWSYKDGRFIKEKSTEYGVAGLFIFEEKSCLSDIPRSGEVVSWMQEQNKVFKELGLAGTREFGLLSEYKALESEKCRPFNKMTIDGDILTKEPIDEQGRGLAKFEKEWYKIAISKGVTNIPKLYSTEPLKMERIHGKNIYEYSGLSLDGKRAILVKLVEALNQLHMLGSVPADTFSIKEAYYNKTIVRLSKIRDLIPFANKKTIIINGRDCRNVYYYKRDFESKLETLICDNFAFIHGDCTFSNMMLKNDDEPVLIDPRGYFGLTEIYGDPNYDWAKLYYSIVGNYDRFNLKDFKLTIRDKDIKLKISSNQWEALEQDFFLMSQTDPKVIKLIHAVIWLSLTTYTWHDYDSVCGAFYNGLYYLEELYEKY